MSKHTIYLAYGSNLNIGQMAYRCPEARVLGSAKLNGYRLVFRGPRGRAVATVERQEGSRVPVLLWEITSRDERSLDHYEGWPHLYRKETAKVSFRGKQVSAMMYVMNEGRPLGAPSLGYYDVIREGYVDAGFNLSVLAHAFRDSATKPGKAEA